MPLNVTVNDQASDIALLWLLTFTDYDDNVELRAVNNLTDVVSRGDTYTAFPFSLVLPADDGPRQQSLKLSFANVGRELMQLVREYAPGRNPKVKLELIESNRPDNVEKRIDFLEVGSVTFDALALTFELLPSSVFARKTCVGTYNQAEFPGLFWALK